jgi:AcrR family transcriptional regulator
MSPGDEHQTAPARRRPQQDRSSAKVESIVSATALLLRATDPSDLTTRTIATSAGVSPATVYRYFRDVDHVVEAVLVAHAEAANAAVSAALATSRHRTVTGVFRLVVDTHLRLYAARPDLTATWGSEELAQRRRNIEIESDRSLARQVGRHLLDKGLIADLTSTEELLLDAHWATAGTLLGRALGADFAARPILLDELRRLVEHFSTRYGPSVTH